MKLIEIIIIAFSLAFDAFAISVCKGLSMKKPNTKNGLIIASYFGVFQAIMPLLGYIFCSYIKNIDTIDHYISCILLTMIGISMIKESLEKKGYVGEFKNENITNKFGHINQKYRQELECPNWSSEPDEFGYRANPNSEIGYEKLDKADSCTFEAYVCLELGYTDYQEFCEAYSEEERKVLEEAYENASEDLRLPEYIY